MRNLLAVKMLLANAHRLYTAEDHEQVLTTSSEVLDRYPESFGPGQKVIFQLGQTFALSYLHADLMLLWCEACSFTVKQELMPEKQECWLVPLFHVSVATRVILPQD